MENIEIKQQFKKRKTRQLLVAIPLLPAVFIIALMDDTGKVLISGIPNLYLLIAAGAIIVSGLIFSLINWRCPNCKKYLGKRFNPKFCASCEAELR